MKIKPISFYLYLIFNHYAFVGFILIPYFYKRLNSSMFLPFLIALVFSYLIGLIPLYQKNPFYSLRRNPYLKYFFILIIYLSFIIEFLCLVESLLLIEESFNKLILFIFIIPSIMLLKKLPITKIFKLSTPFFIIMFLLILINYLFKLNFFDPFNLLPLSAKFDPLGLLLLLYIPMNNSFYMFFKNSLSKKVNLSLINIVILLLTFCELLFLVGIFGYSYLSDFSRTGYLIYSITSNTRYVGGFHFLYLIVITLSSLFYLSIRIAILEMLKKNSSILLIIISILFIYFYKFEWIYYLILISIVLMILFKGCILIDSKRTKEA